MFYEAAPKIISLRERYKTKSQFGDIQGSKNNAGN